MRSEKGFYLIRLVVAGYLAYLGIKLISDMVKGAESENPVLFIFFGIGFIVIAVFLGIWTVKKLMYVSQQEREAREAEEAEAAKEAEEAKAAAGGVAMIEATEGTEATGAAVSEETTAASAAEGTADNGPVSIADRIRMLSAQPEEEAEEITEAAAEVKETVEAAEEAKETVEAAAEEATEKVPEETKE